MVEKRQQAMPMAETAPRPRRAGLCAMASEPNPATAVKPARMTGLMMVAKAYSLSPGWRMASRM